MARANSEVVSNLPVYTAKRSKDFASWLIVTCPYEDCGQPFLVRASTWLKTLKRTAKTTGKQYEIVGRVCPYCFRTGRKPTRSAIG